MNILDGVSWGLIPARGGSKSIRLKNLVPFAGRPLLDYQVLAARGSGRIERLICSTDSVKIAEHCVTLDIEVHDRPRELSGDNVPVLSVITHLLNDIDAREGGVAELIALLQPTSPFLLPSHIAECVDALLTHPEAASAQTVIPCPHAHHAVNQRVIEGGAVAFRYPDKRARAFNKQRKQQHYLFGNLVVFRSTALVAQKTPFPVPSLPVEIAPPYGFDLDVQEDVTMGELMLEAGVVSLPRGDDTGR